MAHKELEEVVEENIAYALGTALLLNELTEVGINTYLDQALEDIIESLEEANKLMHEMRQR